MGAPATRTVTRLLYTAAGSAAEVLTAASFDETGHPASARSVLRAVDAVPALQRLDTNLGDYDGEAELDQALAVLFPDFGRADDRPRRL